MTAHTRHVSPRNAAERSVPARFAPGFEYRDFTPSAELAFRTIDARTLHGALEAVPISGADKPLGARLLKAVVAELHLPMGETRCGRERTESLAPQPRRLLGHRLAGRLAGRRDDLGRGHPRVTGELELNGAPSVAVDAVLPEATAPEERLQGSFQVPLNAMSGR